MDTEWCSVATQMGISLGKTVTAKLDLQDLINPQTHTGTSGTHAHARALSALKKNKQKKKD